MQFEVGKSYYRRSLIDYSRMIRVTVAKRTKKAIFTPEGRQFLIFKNEQGHEAFSHFGEPLAPEISADMIKSA